MTVISGRSAHKYTHSTEKKSANTLPHSAALRWCFSRGRERAGSAVAVQRPQERGAAAGTAQLPGLPAPGAGQPVLRGPAVAHRALSPHHRQRHLLCVQEVRDSVHSKPA